jgi:hypothetical protein
MFIHSGGFVLLEAFCVFFALAVYLFFVCMRGNFLRSAVRCLIYLVYRIRLNYIEGEQMLVNNRMMSYRTTPTEKLLGTVNKYAVIGYLEGIKTLVSDSETLIKAQEQKFTDAIVKAEAQVSEWEAEYIQLHTKALRAELKRKLEAPTSATHWLSAEEIRLPIRDEVISNEIAELLKRRPDYRTYQIARGDVGAPHDIQYSRAWSKGNKTLVGINRLTTRRVEQWQASLDSLISDLKDRNKQEVYIAQVMELKRTTATILANWGIDTTKTERKDRDKPKPRSKTKK